MGKVAFLFSGQGAQHPGMGLGFAALPEIKELFDAAEAACPGILSLMEGGSAEELKQTRVTQPATYLADVAGAMYLERLGVVPQALAGFSLGELAALAMGGAYSPEAGFRLVLARAAAMEKACQETPSAMLAVLRLPTETVEELCAQVPGAYPANYNSSGQVVVSGDTVALEAVKCLVAEQKGRSLPLAVSGGFHSPYMTPAAVAFGQVLADIPFSPLTIPVYANVTAQPYGEAIGPVLETQIDHSVLWAQTLGNLWADGCDTFVEVGVGSVLSNLVRKVLPQARAYSVENPEQAQALASQYKEGTL